MSSRMSQQENDYWNEARRPLPCLLFLLPWILAYELGVSLLDRGDADRLRNGADFWMRNALSTSGLGSGVLLPVLVVAGLIVWHLIRKHPWRLRMETQLGMFAESILLAVGLVAVGQLHQLLFLSLSPVSDAESLNVLTLSVNGWSRAVSYIGAGVYEEVMFRLFLVPATFGLLRLLSFSKSTSAVVSAIATALLFATAHHIGPTADTFSLFAFTFRAAAGLFFACVFFLRGFGITVGCHAAYDLLVGVLLVSPAATV